MADMEKEGYITTVNPMLSTDTVHGNTGHTNHDSNGSSRRRSSQLLGKTFFLDDEVVWRINWMQRGMSVCLCFAILCYVAGNDERSPALQFATILFCGMGLLCFAFVCYRNVSFMVIKRLLKEPSVLTIVALTTLNLCMEIVSPFPFSVVYGLAYMLLQCCYSGTGNVSRRNLHQNGFKKSPQC